MSCFWTVFFSPMVTYRGRGVVAGWSFGVSIGRWLVYHWNLEPNVNGRSAMTCRITVNDGSDKLMNRDLCSLVSVMVSLCHSLYLCTSYSAFVPVIVPLFQWLYLLTNMHILTLSLTLIIIFAVRQSGIHGEPNVFDRKPTIHIWIFFTYLSLKFWYDQTGFLFLLKTYWF